jgi:hypothetical protein
MWDGECVQRPISKLTASCGIYNLPPQQEQVCSGKRLSLQTAVRFFKDTLTRSNSRVLLSRFSDKTGH